MKAITADQIARLRLAINEFCQREYGEKDPYTYLAPRMDVAYTVASDGITEIQTTVLPTCWHGWWSATCPRMELLPLWRQRPAR